MPKDFFRNRCFRGGPEWFVRFFLWVFVIIFFKNKVCYQTKLSTDELVPEGLLAERGGGGHGRGCDVIAQHAARRETGLCDA